MLGAQPAAVASTAEKWRVGKTTNVGREVFSALTVAPNGKSVYAISSGYGAGKGWLAVFRASTDALLARIHVGVSPEAVVVTPNNRTVYVTSNGPDPSGSAQAPRGKVWVVSAATRRVVKTIKVGWGPVGAVASPDGKHVYVANDGGFDLPTSISVISTATNTVEHTVSVPGVFSLAINASGSRLYALDQYGRVTAVSTTTYHVLYSMQAARHSGGFGNVQALVTPDGNTVYALLDGDKNGWVVAIRATDGHVLGRAIVKDEPWQMVAAPNGKRVYAVSLGNGNDVTRQKVSVISTATNRVTKSITVGYAPLGLAITADGRSVLVANSIRKAGMSDSGGTVSVIDTGKLRVRQTLEMPSTSAQNIVASPTAVRAYVTANSPTAVASVSLLTGRLGH